MQYEERYCAYVDILGFSGLIRQLSEGRISVNRIRAVLQSIYEPPKGDKIREFMNSDLRVQNISDAVCLSSRCSRSGLSHLFWTIDELARGLLEEGFFIRGAVVKGRLFHDEKMVFGEALVSAYTFESTVAHYPRVMVTRAVVEDAFAYDDNDETWTYALDYLTQAEDGPFYVNVLNIFGSSLDAIPDGPAQLPYLALYGKIARQIQRRYDEAVDNPRHFEKVQWFARYWNRSLANQPQVNKIAGPGLEPRPFQ